MSVSTVGHGGVGDSMLAEGGDVEDAAAAVAAAGGDKGCSELALVVAKALVPVVVINVVGVRAFGGVFMWIPSLCRCHLVRSKVPNPHTHRVRLSGSSSGGPSSTFVTGRS